MIAFSFKKEEEERLAVSIEICGHVHVMDSSLLFFLIFE